MSRCQKDIDGKKSIIIDSGKYPEPQMDQLQTFWHDDDVHLLPGEGVPVEFARGCIFKCKFCSYPMNGKQNLDFVKDPELLYQELSDNYKNFGIKHYMIVDDTFNDHKEKLESILFEEYL